MVAVAESSSSSGRFFFECDFPRLVKKNIDREVRCRSFFVDWGDKGDENVGGGWKKGITEVAGEVGRTGDEQRDR